MSAPKRVALITGLVVVAALLAGGIWLYRSLSYVPAFYSEALARSNPDLNQSSREMLRRTAALTNDVKRSGTWEAVFADEQINGWLAVDVPKNHPDMIPPQARNPRVQIAPGKLMAGAQIEDAISAVVSLELDVRLVATNVLAVRIQKLRVGDVPWALDQIIDEVIAAAREWGMQVEQTQTDGDPVLIWTMPAEIEGRRILLEQLELREGEVFLSGRTK